MSNGDWLSRRRRLFAGGSDGGFTLTEVLVAIAVIGVVMTAVTPLFISGVSVVNSQRGRQVAVQLAADAVERVRALKGANVITGRDATTSAEEWAAPAPGVAPYRQRMDMASDPAAVDGQGADVSTALPTRQRADRHPRVNGIEYTQHWYVGQCWQPLRSGGDCGRTGTGVPFFRVVVAVTWTDKTCGGGPCSYVTSTLVSNAANDPVFNSTDSAQPPIAKAPFPQVGEVGVTLGSLGIGGPGPQVQLTESGGAPPIKFSVQQGLPPGLTCDPNGLITGTPTTVGTYLVQFTATDDFGLSGTNSFQWTINARPTLTSPGAQQSTVTESVSKTIPLQSGTVPMTWSASGLPDGLSINNGVISGKPTTAGSRTVTVTVTDNFNVSASVSFGWTVNQAPTVTNPGKQIMADDTVVSLPMKGAGGTGSLTWSASGLPTGLSINNTTGVISGKPSPGAQPYLSITVTATDSHGVSGSTTFAWEIIDIRVNKVGDTVNLQFYLAGGAKPVASSETNLPPGLSITPSGMVTGTITGGTRFQPNLKFTDASGKVVPWDFVWQVTDNTGVRITAPTGDRMTDPIGKAVSFTATAAGGSGMGYRWTTTGTGLPPGVSISTGGVVSGTPTTAGTYTVKLTVTDPNNKSAVFMFTWGIQ